MSVPDVPDGYVRAVYGVDLPIRRGSDVIAYVFGEWRPARVGRRNARTVEVTYRRDGKPFDLHNPALLHSQRIPVGRVAVRRAQ